MKFAMAGTGGIAHFHARAIAAAGAQLTAVTNHRNRSLAEFAGVHNVASTYPTLADLLDAEPIDALVVATPNSLHAEQTIAAVERGVHVLLEKPPALNAEEAGKIAAAEAAGDAVVMAAHCLRFDEQVRWLRDRIASGDIGEPVHVAAFAVHQRFAPGGWFIDPRLSGGGALMDLGVHAIDAIRFVLGDPQPATVSAHVGTHFGGLDVDDTAVVDVCWESGATSIVEAGWLHPYAPGPVGTLRVTGTRGYAQTFPALCISADGTETRDSEQFPARPTELEHEQRYHRQMRGFIDAIESRTPPTPGVIDAIAGMRVIDAAYQSARERITVKIGSD